MGPAAGMWSQFEPLPGFQNGPNCDHPRPIDRTRQLEPVRTLPSDRRRDRASAAGRPPCATQAPMSRGDGGCRMSRACPRAGMARCRRRRGTSRAPEGDRYGTDRAHQPPDRCLAARARRRADRADRDRGGARALPARRHRRGVDLGGAQRRGSAQLLVAVPAERAAPARAASGARAVVLVAAAGAAAPRAAASRAGAPGPPARGPRAPGPATARPAAAGGGTGRPGAPRRGAPRGPHDRAGPAAPRRAAGAAVHQLGARRHPLALPAGAQPSRADPARSAPSRGAPGPEAPRFEPVPPRSAAPAEPAARTVQAPVQPQPRSQPEPEPAQPARRPATRTRPAPEPRVDEDDDRDSAIDRLFAPLSESDQTEPIPAVRPRTPRQPRS